MNKLTETEIDYVLFHLGHHIELTSELKSRMVFGKHEGQSERKIIFPLSDAPLQIDRVIISNNVPVIFPLSDSDATYEFSTSSLIFNHDLLKSAFFLLSGIQEYQNPMSRDRLNRFAFEDSIQNRLNITHIPVVNYYFEMIADGIEKFCNYHELPFKRKKLFKTFGFQLSHDIDRVDLYDFSYIGYKLKEIFGLVDSRLARITNLRLFFTGLMKYIGLQKNDNPYWNFKYLRDTERRHNFKSIFYFLDQGVRHSDAPHSFFEPRMKELFTFVKDEGCEIALHGPSRSLDSYTIMRESLKKLEEASGAKIIGNRQHRLLWKHPQTADILQQTGLHYDSTLGFAAHEGFRNSYCYPFKIYNFDEAKMMDIWEFPLTGMDGTLLSYRQYSNAQALKACTMLAEEVKKFGGLFTLLWHNSFFDENTYPGVTKLYENILEMVADQKPECILGADLRNRMNSYSDRS